MNPNRNFLGTGWAFPPTFSKRAVPNKCTVLVVSEEQDIRESLHILLSTRPGERVMRPDYGCNLEDLLFDPININLQTYVKEMLSKAILYYEPRIDLQDIQVDVSNQNAGILLITLVYDVRTTNSRYNLVFDYYKNEVTITSNL